MNPTQKLEIRPGDTISEASLQAVALAKREQCEITFDFNEVKLTATPHSHPAELEDYYYANRSKTQNDLIATTFMFKADFETHSTHPVTFNRMRSPFYEGERWAVRRGGSCLNKDGEWEWEPQPSSRDADFYARCRFDSMKEARAAFERSQLVNHKSK